MHLSAQAAHEPRQTPASSPRQSRIRGKVARILHVRPKEIILDFCQLPESEKIAFVTAVPHKRISEIVCSAYPEMLGNWSKGVLNWRTQEQSVRHFFGNLLPYIWYSLAKDEPDVTTAIRVLTFIGNVHRSINRNAIFRLAQKRLASGQQDAGEFLEAAEPLLTHRR